LLAINNSVKLIGLSIKSTKVVFLSAKLLFVYLKLLVELIVLGLDFLNFSLDLLAHLLLLKNVAFCQVNSDLNALNVLAHGSCLHVLAVGFVHLADKSLDTRNSCTHHGFKISDQLLQCSLSLVNELLVGWRLKVALNKVLLFGQFCYLLVTAADVLQELLDQLADQLFVGPALYCSNLALQYTHAILPR
jgi:hypothetical protein